MVYAPEPSGVYDHELGDSSSRNGEIGHDFRDLNSIPPQQGAIIVSNPRPPQRLGWFSVICIICNRMIGTGIFRTPSTVIRYSHSVGVSLLFWLAGAVAAVAGIFVFIEFGLTTPRYNFEGRGKVSVPRSGGELNYLKDLLRKPAYFTTCVFGIAFILLGNVATNSLMFGIRVLSAAGRPADNLTVRGIAIAVVTFACLLHGIWRSAGIYINNTFAVTKVALLVFTIGIGLAALGKAFPQTQPTTENFSSPQAFGSVSTDAYAMADSFLAIIFAYGGFNQANYVLSEIDNPRRNYKWPAFSAVVGVSILYMAVNIVYMLVVPFSYQVQINPQPDVAQKFFELTIGTINNGSSIGPRVLDAFMAVSSLGNILVMTFTAARVKQEIAMEGILPFRDFLSRNLVIPGIPFGRIFCRPTRAASEATPVGALILHWSLSVTLILATAFQTNPLDSYTVLVDLYSYVVDAFFGCCLGVGLLTLRLSRKRKWSSKSWEGSGVPPFVSVIAATIVTIVNAYPLIGYLIPPSPAFLKITTTDISWFTVPTIGWSVIAAGVIYWAIFRYIVPLVGGHQGYKLKTERELFLHEEHGYPVQWHERLFHQWVVRRNDENSSHFVETNITYMSRDSSDPS